jgi:hypothetical protein
MRELPPEAGAGGGGRFSPDTAMVARTALLRAGEAPSLLRRTSSLTAGIAGKYQHAGDERM